MDIIDKLHDLIRKIKEYFIRGKKGWAASDTWELDCYLSKVIRESIKYLKETHYGYPSEFSNSKEWDKILNKIINTFKITENLSMQNALILSNQEDKDLYDKLQEKYGVEILTEEQIKEYNEGWELFRKYFLCLWD